MQVTCKQCGKQFELTKSEMDFYREKGLSFPKRCKECRQANKQKKNTVPMTGAHAVPRDDRKKPDFKWGVIAVAILLLLGVIFKSVTVILPHLSEPEQEVVESRVWEMPSGTEHRQKHEAAMESLQANLAESLAQTQPETTAEPESMQESVPASAEPAEATVEPTAEPAKQTVGSEAGNQSKSDAPAQTVQAPAPKPAAASYRFRNEKLLKQHYEKHGIEMGFASAADYEAAASAVITNPNALHKTEAEDGDGVYYIEATNEFVILSTDGYIRTYFYPSSGIDYYNRQ